MVIFPLRHLDTDTDRWKVRKSVKIDTYYSKKRRKLIQDTTANAPTTLGLPIIALFYLRSGESRSLHRCACCFGGVGGSPCGHFGTTRGSGVERGKEVLSWRSEELLLRLTAVFFFGLNLSSFFSVWIVTSTYYN